MSKLATAGITSLLLSGSICAYAQVESINYNNNRVMPGSYYFGANVDDPDGESFFVRNRYTAADAYFYEGIDPVPVQLGVFETRPVLRLSPVSRSNVFLSENDEVSDTLVGIAPSIAATTTWSRHRLGLDAIVQHEEYLDSSEESATQYGIRGFGQLDISSNFAIAGSIAQENLRENRVNVGGVINSRERVELDRTGVEANAAYFAQRVRLRGRLSQETFDFSDVTSPEGVLLDQDFRDYDETRIAANVEYAVSRDWAVIAELENVDREYDNLTAAGINRDISGNIVRVGTSFELPVSLRGQVSAEYQSFDPADPTLEDIDEFGLNADLRWFVTQLTTARAFASRRVSDAGTTGASNALVSTYGVGLDHELLRTVILSGSLNYETREFNPFDREDEQTTFDVGAVWKLNQNIQVRGGYRFTKQESDFDPFEDNVLSLRLSFFP
ncbi:MAG: outer membrane beta-barrel protein [Pseudomonadota bacterium]